MQWNKNIGLSISHKKEKKADIMEKVEIPD